MKRLGLFTGLLVLVLFASACQCGHKADLTNLTTSWTSLEENFSSKLNEAKTKYESLLAQFKNVKVDAADAFASQEYNKLDGFFKHRESGLNELAGLFEKHKGALEAAIKSANVAGFKQALKTAKADFESATAKFADFDNRNKDIESLLARVTALTNFAAANKRENAQLEAGAALSFNDIDFKVGSAEFDFSRPESKAALEKLKTFVSSCPELTINVYGHSSKEGDATQNQTLSQTRAIAVQKWLITQKVDKKKIVLAEGKGSSEPAIPEPDADSPEAKALDATTLENIRRVNRRISVQVIEPCKDPQTPAPKVEAHAEKK